MGSEVSVAILDGDTSITFEVRFVLVGKEGGPFASWCSGDVRIALPCTFWLGLPALAGVDAGLDGWSHSSECVPKGA